MSNLIDFSVYPDGTLASEISGLTVWTGDYTVENGVLSPVSSTPNTRVVVEGEPDGVYVCKLETLQVSATMGAVFRGVDSDNYWVLRGSSQGGNYEVYKYINGSGTYVTGLIGTYKGSVEHKIKLKGDRIEIHQNGDISAVINDSTHKDGTYFGARTDSASHGIAYMRPQKEVWAENTSRTYQGKALKATKLGVIFTPHSKLEYASATEEFWTSPMSTDRIPNWPFSQYPMIVYSSTDHAAQNETGTVVGGIFARVWDKNVGGMDDPEAWFEWNQISNRAEFDHISTKSEPIYNDPSFPQTETPTPIMLNGVVHLFYHNLGVTSEGYGIGCQTTSSAVSTNGIDFTIGKRAAVTYNPYLEQGDGHTGYLNITTNPIPKYPYQFLANSTHGGGEVSRSPAQAIWGTNDLENFERIHIWGRYKGNLSKFDDTENHPDVNWFWALWDINSIRQEGNYWRMIVVMRPDVLGGGLDDYTRPLEILVDDNFNVVSEPNPFIPLGTNDDFDAYELHHIKEFPLQDDNGNRFALYKGLNSSGSSSFGLCKLEDIDYDWQIMREHTDRNVIHSFDSSSTLSFDTSQGEVDGRVTQLIPADSTAKWEAATIIPNEYDVIDFDLTRFGRIELDNNCYGEVGFFDNIDNPTAKLIFSWGDGLDSSFSLKMQTLSDTISSTVNSKKTIGFINSGGLQYNDEAPRAAQNIGLRLHPKEGIFYFRDGIALTSIGYTDNIDMSQPMTIGYKLQNPEDTDGTMAFEKATVTTYSDQQAGDNSNNKPTAIITGTGIDYAPNSTVPLVCEAEDSDGDTLTYLWEQLNNGAPAITIADPTSASTSFLAEAEDANIAVRCTVSDGTDSVIASATFYITEGSNAAPTVTINASKTTVDSGEQFTLTANASDTDGTIASYLWEQVDNGSDSVSISSTNSASTNVTAFSSSAQQTVKLRVTVTDDDGAVGSREVDIVVLATANQPPTANADPDRTPALVAQMVGKNGASLWQYDSTDSPSEVSKSGYFVDGVALGMKVGDVVTQIDTVGATVHHMYTVKSLNSDGSLNLSDGTAIN